jgi:hypothetical protein
MFSTTTGLKNSSEYSAGVIGVEIPGFDMQTGSLA